MIFTGPNPKKPDGTIVKIAPSGEDDGKLINELMKAGFSVQLLDGQEYCIQTTIDLSFGSFNLFNATLRKGKNKMAGSGYMSELRERLLESYREELTKMIGPRGGRGGFSKKQVEDFCCGFNDGMRNLLHHLKEMGIVEIEEEVEK